MLSAEEERIVCCPHCGSRYPVPAAVSDKDLLCLHCNQPLTFCAPAATDATPSLSQFPAPQPPMREMQQGETLGSYTITCRIGKGGMGTVYKAMHSKTGKDVAIKSLTISDADSPTTEHTRRFLREARLAAAIRHPNVVQVIGFIQRGGQYHIIQEYVGGGSIKSLLMQEGTLPEKRVLEIGLGTARALAEAAKVRIVHRDIKPDNIMLAEDGTPKLADLGLATQTHDGGLLPLAQLTPQELASLGDMDTGFSLTMSNMAMGTPAYMAPEQAVDSRTVDQRADIYSLGATLYHMLCGDPPYIGRNMREVLSLHRHAPVPDPRTRRPGVSDRTAAIIQRCMAKTPAQRYQSAAELAEELETHLTTFQPTENPAEIGKAVHFLEQESLAAAAGSSPTPPTGVSGRSRAALPPEQQQTMSAQHSARVLRPVPVIAQDAADKKSKPEKARFSRVGSRENITFLIAVLLAACLMYAIYEWAESYTHEQEQTVPKKPQIKPLGHMEEFSVPPAPSE